MPIISETLDWILKIIAGIGALTDLVITIKAHMSIKKHKIRQKVNSGGGQKPEKPDEKQPKLLISLKRTRKLAFSLFVFFILCLAFLFLNQVFAGPVNLAGKAWDAFNSKKYDEAIKYAGKAIDLELTGALNLQNSLASANQPAPPIGPAGKESAAYNETISRGPLNDVGTSYYIIGWSEEILGNTAEAKKAYQEAVKFTYARCWDPKGWFWSPSQEAAGRLARLP